MFNFVHLDKNKKLIDIRLEKSLDSENFHHMGEYLGLLNIVFIIAWELNITHIKVNSIIGCVKFNGIFSSYSITQHFGDIQKNHIELIHEDILLRYENHVLRFNYGFTNWKSRNVPVHKSKIRPDVLTVNSPCPNENKRSNILKQLSNKNKTFLVLGADSDLMPGSYKLFIPDVFNKKELRYTGIVDKARAHHIIKKRIYKTRSYAMIFYSWEKSRFVPSHILYLSGSSSCDEHLRNADTEFQSILYNCLPTPKFSKKELRLISNYYKKNDNLYRDSENKTMGIAIDPPGSKDKDDAISFNIVYNKSQPVFLEMFVHISDVPPVLNCDFTNYHFYYGFHKLETDYMLGCRYPMIDPNLSESDNSISLIGPNKRSYTLKITYRYKPNKTKSHRYIYDIPEKVEMYLEKNIKIFATTYESIAVNTTDYSKDLSVNNIYNENSPLVYNDKPIQTLNPIPSEPIPLVNIDSIKWENKSDIKSKSDRDFLQNQLDSIAQIYKTLIQSLTIVQDIKPMLQSKQYYNDDYTYNLREEWVHRLIEITALESNKYAALILYKKIKNKQFGITDKTIGILDKDEIIKYNDLFSSQDRFLGPIKNNEGIFRGLYYGVKAHNDSPEFVKNTYNKSLPSSLLDYVKSYEKITDLPNLYLKFQLDKISQDMSPMEKILATASFSQSSDNLGVALYSSGIRPHLNAKLYYYTFFTSPMRRIVDCFVQYCLISDEKKCMKVLELFKTKLLNRTDINSQCEKNNLYLSVCNKIFKGDNKGVFETFYIKYGNEHFSNIYLPNLDITLSVGQNIGKKLKSEGRIKIKFNQITEAFNIEILNNGTQITREMLIEENKQLYFQKEQYPENHTHNYKYLNYRYLM